MTNGPDSPLVATDWLARRSGSAGVKVLDASAYLPTSGRDARSEYRAGHVPGAVFADLEWLSDETAALPHMLPSARVFAERIGSLGVGSDDMIVVYDGSGENFSAPRLWWMLRTFGHERVAVLDGGLRKWSREGRMLESAVPEPRPATFVAHLDSTRVRGLAAMRALLTSHAAHVVDARSSGRFAGTEPEPRGGVRGGHIPGSANVHYARLVHADGTMRAPDDLRALFTSAGVDLARPVVASCGTGVTACTLVLALEVLGVRDAAVYDGSWTEWGGRADTPVQTGRA
jgi:thiosulfate/3-mercaptopyruvate sulfurtransferase